MLPPLISAGQRLSPSIAVWFALTFQSYPSAAEKEKRRRSVRSCHVSLFMSQISNLSVKNFILQYTCFATLNMFI